MSTEPTPDTDTPSAPSLPAATARRSRRARLVGLLGVAIVGAGCWLATGEPGLIAAGVIGLCWYLLSGPYAVAIGHGAFLLFPTEALAPAPAPALLIAEAGLGVVLVAPAVDTDAPGAFVGLFLGSLGGLLALSVAIYWWSSLLWVTAAVLLGALGVAGYGLYRYELVRLGLVEGETA